MIAINFNPRYEDRLSLMFREHKRNNPNFKYRFISAPFGLDQNKAYWVIELQHTKQTNAVLRLLKDSKYILGIDDLEFSYAYDEKELYSQTDSVSMRMIEWFKV